MVEAAAFLHEEGDAIPKGDLYRVGGTAYNKNRYMLDSYKRVIGSTTLTDKGVINYVGAVVEQQKVLARTGSSAVPFSSRGYSGGVMTLMTVPSFSCNVVAVLKRVWLQQNPENPRWTGTTDASMTSFKTAAACFMAQPRKTDKVTSDATDLLIAAYPQGASDASEFALAASANAEAGKRVSLLNLSTFGDIVSIKVVTEPGKQSDPAYDLLTVVVSATT